MINIHSMEKKNPTEILTLYCEFCHSQNNQKIKFPEIDNATYQKCLTHVSTLVKNIKKQELEKFYQLHNLIKNSYSTTTKDQISTYKVLIESFHESCIKSINPPQKRTNTPININILKAEIEKIKIDDTEKKNPQEKEIKDIQTKIYLAEIIENIYEKKYIVEETTIKLKKSIDTFYKYLLKKNRDFLSNHIEAYYQAWKSNILENVDAKIHETFIELINDFMDPFADHSSLTSTKNSNNHTPNELSDEENKD